jgi:hypothetical protein
MKSIRSLSLTLIIFSLFSISYLVTSVAAHNIPHNDATYIKDCVKNAGKKAPTAACTLMHNRLHNVHNVRAAEVYGARERERQECESSARGEDARQDERCKVAGHTRRGGTGVLGTFDDTLMSGNQAPVKPSSPGKAKKQMRKK